MAQRFPARYKELYEIVRKLPKTELHLHLDGSLSCDFIMNAAKANGHHLPSECFAGESALRDLLMQEKALQRANQNTSRSVIAQYIAEKYASSSNWKIFDFCNQFLQTKENLFNATKQLVINLATAHNVRVLEVRFCPALHTLDGLRADEVTEAVINGYSEGVSCIREGKQIEVKGGVIVCILRSFNAQHWSEMVRLTAQYLDKGVIGMDIAGNEADFPLSIFCGQNHNILAQCEHLKIPLTIHAGEFPVLPETNENIATALKYKKAVRRIGHGLTLQFESELMQQVSSSGIGVECCLTSNVGGGKKCKNYASHPIQRMRKAGIKCCLNSDNLLLSGDATLVCDPSNEVVQYMMQCNADWHEVKAVLMNGAQMSFDKTIDEQWLKRFEAQIDGVINEAQKTLQSHGLRALIRLNELIRTFDET